MGINLVVAFMSYKNKSKHCEKQSLMLHPLSFFTHYDISIFTLRFSIWFSITNTRRFKPFMTEGNNNPQRVIVVHYGE